MQRPWPRWECPVSGERRLVTIGHSYVVAENRRLAHEIAVAGRGRWSVVAIAPSDTRVICVRSPSRRSPGKPAKFGLHRCAFARVPHLMWYADLAGVMPRQGRRRALLGRAVRAGRRRRSLVGTPASARLVFATFQNLAKRYPWPLSGFERASLARANGWIAFGETVSATLSPRPIYARRPHRVISPGVDVDRFRPDESAGREVRRALGWSVEDRVVGYLGRFVAQKGVLDLCAALERLSTPWKALFVGGGPLQPELERFAAAHPGRVHVENRATHGDVPRWLNAMTVLCAPSRTTPRWREQFGRMLIEAMACGVPVLASDSGEIPFVVGEAGRVLAEASPARWAAALDEWLPDDARLAERAPGGALSGREARFAWPVVARAHLAFFDALAAGEACIVTPLRVAILADYLEEGWPSMDLVADMLVEHLRGEHAGRHRGDARPPAHAAARCRVCRRGSPAEGVRRRSRDRQRNGTTRAHAAAGSRRVRRVPHRRSQLRAPRSRRCRPAGPSSPATTSTRSARCWSRRTSRGRRIYRGMSRAHPHRPAARGAGDVRQRGDARQSHRGWPGFPRTQLSVIPNGTDTAGWSRPASDGGGCEAGRLLGRSGAVELLHVGSTIAAQADRRAAGCLRRACGRIRPARG